MQLRIAPSGTHFEDTDGTPFFWLADTAWNTALKGDTADWHRYLEARQRQGFTVVQFVAAPWRGCRNPVHGPLFSETGDGCTFDEHAWAKMEEWLGLVNDYGMVPAPVMIWDNNPDDPFFTNRNGTCITAGRRMVERWERFHPVWLLGGDGDYRSAAQAARWKEIGRAVFADAPDRVVTMHPGGLTWVGDIFRDEPWYSFVGIQSGHGAGPDAFAFLLNGPYTSRWMEIRKPFINLEPNYELAAPYQDHASRFGAYHVRRASWWSVLGAPPAGITYGNSPVWIWTDEPDGQAEGHSEIWTAGPWETGLETEGIAHLGVMRNILDSLPWTRLRPADHVLARQPGAERYEAYQKAAATGDLSIVVVYLPLGGNVVMAAALPATPSSARWVNPRTGEDRPAAVTADARGLLTATAPSDEDWLLVLENG